MDVLCRFANFGLRCCNKVRLAPSPQFLAHLYSGQTAECINMPLDMKVGLSPGDCVRWGPSPPTQKGAQPPIFGPRLLWPNGCMDQDATWDKGRPRRRPQPTRHCVRWGPSSPSRNFHKGTQIDPQFSASVCFGQTSGWTMMPLAIEVGLGLGDFGFDGEPAAPENKAHPPPPNFWPMSFVAKRPDG